MIAKLICTDGIRQRPAMRERTSRSASSSDSRVKRSASSAARPIVLPSRMPLTDSDSSTSELMSARRPWRSVVMRLRSLPDAAGQPDEERQQREREAARRQSSANIATIVGQHRGDVGDDRGRRRGDDVLHAADVVGDPRLHLARAGAREERERQALQVAVDRGAQVVHDALADEVGEPRLRHAEDAGGDRRSRSSRARARSAAACPSRGSPGRGPRAAGTARSCSARPRARSARARWPAARGKAGRGGRCERCPSAASTAVQDSHKVDYFNYLDRPGAAARRPPPRRRGRPGARRRPATRSARACRAAPPPAATRSCCWLIACASAPAIAASSSGCDEPPGVAVGRRSRRGRSVDGDRGQPAGHPLHQHRAELLAHRGQHHRVRRREEARAAPRVRASRRGRGPARRSRAIDVVGMLALPLARIAAHEHERRGRGQRGPARARGADEQSEPLDRGEAPHGQSTGPSARHDDGLGGVGDAPSSPPGTHPRGSRPGRGARRGRGRRRRGAKRSGSKPLGLMTQRSGSIPSSFGAAHLARREHAGCARSRRPSRASAGPRLRVRPLRRGPVGDALEHQQLGPVEVADDRHPGRHARRGLVDRREVVQVQDVGLGRAGGSSAPAQASTCASYSSSSTRGEDVVGRPGAVLVGGCIGASPASKSTARTSSPRVEGSASPCSPRQRARDDGHLAAVLGQLARERPGHVG